MSAAKNLTEEHIQHCQSSTLDFFTCYSEDRNDFLSKTVTKDEAKIVIETP